MKGRNNVKEVSGVQLSGRDWKVFSQCKSVWAEHTHWDDTLIFVDGGHVEDEAADAADDAVIRVETGFLLDPVEGAPEDLVDCIEWWLAKQSTVRMVVEVPKGEEHAMMAAVLAAGGRVIAG